MGRLARAREHELIRLARRGDAEAFGELVARHQETVFSIAYRLTRTRQEAEDVAQDAFIKAYQALDRFDLERPFVPWLHRITTNTALNCIRRRRPEAELVEETLLADPAPGPEARTVASEESARLRAAVAMLPPNYRAAIDLRHFQGFSYREISDALNVPLSDVKSWLFRARRRLRDALGSDRADSAE